MTVIKSISSITLTLLAAGALFTSCEADKVTYSGAERVLFADTMATYPILAEDKGFDVAVASTVTCDYDRTFGVEIVDKGSTAIENYHYRLETNNVTIKAGEGSGVVRLLANYDHFEASDSLGVVLRLIVPDQLNWESLYPTQTKVVFMKCCPFDASKWVADGGNFMLYATFPLSESSVVHRLVKAEVAPDGKHIIFKKLISDVYDITMHFDDTDPLEPTVEVLPQISFADTNYGVIYMQTDDSVDNY
ncbi:MAG: DUF4984 domain-containing protein, partial [Alistipes sp.]